MLDLQPIFDQPVQGNFSLGRLDNLQADVELSIIELLSKVELDQGGELAIILQSKLWGIFWRIWTGDMLVDKILDIRSDLMLHQVF